MIDSLLALTAWTAVPLLMALVSWARERHVSRFPDCPVCMAQEARRSTSRGAKAEGSVPTQARRAVGTHSDAQNAPSERLTALR